MEEIIEKLFNEALKIENNKIITDRDKAFEYLIEITKNTTIASINCRALISELRTFGDDPEKVKIILELLKENLKKVKNQQEVRSIISRLMRVFFRIKKIKLNKESFELDILDEEENND